jgi:allantoin racemase
MKILFIGPDTKLSYLRSNASPQFQVDASAPQNVLGTVESRYDELLYSPAVVERAIWAEKQGYDACIAACFADAGVYAAREVVSIPVVGPGESSLAVAAMLGDRFSIVTVLDHVVGILREKVKSFGMESRLASIRAIGMRVQDVREQGDLAVKKAGEVGALCIEEDGAEVLIMGCGSLSTHAPSIQEALQVPVINPLLVSLKATEALLGSGLTHSKRTYPQPLSLES